MSQQFRRTVYYFRKLSYVYACATCHSLEFQPLIKKHVHNQCVRFQTGHFRSQLIKGFKTFVPESTKENNSTETITVENDITNGVSNNNSANFAECLHCGSKSIHMGGPIYTAPIHDLQFVKSLIER